MNLRGSIVPLLLAIVLHSVFAFNPRFITQSPTILRRILRAPLSGSSSTPTSITFHKPVHVVPELSPIELAIDSTFGFVASEEASKAACQRVPGLTDHQRNLCRSNPGLIWALVDGTQLGFYECAHQFKDERWNCSVARVVLGKSRSEGYSLVNDQSHVANLVGGLEKTLKRGRTPRCYEIFIIFFKFQFRQLADPPAFILFPFNHP